MSKLIVEMEMPKKNRFCELQCADLYCIKTLKKCNVFDTGERPSRCPIVGELPEQHGDLIDRDAYLHLLESYIESKRGVCENKEFIVALQAISKQIKCVEAVIAAERKDDDKDN